MSYLGCEFIGYDASVPKKNCPKAILLDWAILEVGPFISRLIAASGQARLKNPYSPGSFRTFPHLKLTCSSQNKSSKRGCIHPDNKV